MYLFWEDTCYQNDNDKRKSDSIAICVNLLLNRAQVSLVFIFAMLTCLFDQMAFLKPGTSNFPRKSGRQHIFDDVIRDLVAGEAKGRCRDRDPLFSFDPLSG